MNYSPCNKIGELLYIILLEIKPRAMRGDRKDSSDEKEIKTPLL